MRRPIDRRDFVRAAGAAFAAALLPRQAAALAAGDAVFAAAFKAENGGYGVALLTEAGHPVFTLPLPGRGHDVVAGPGGRNCVAFARRPGTFALAFDRSRGREPAVFATPADRHFYGHGAFSADGRLLFATENDFGHARGAVGIYDATDGFRRIGEFDSHGVGPHELVLLPDARTLAVANGGIETHPDFGREKLNVGMMKPSLVLIDSTTGDLVEKHDLPPRLSRLSLRHLDCEPDGRIWFGCQYQGEAAEPPPLAGSLRPGEPLAWLEIPAAVALRMRNYVGSVAVNPRSRLLGLTSPEGGVLVRVPLDDPRRLDVRAISGVSAIAATADDFFTTSMDHPGEGSVRWDNHLCRLRPLS